MDKEDLLSNYSSLGLTSGNTGAKLMDKTSDNCDDECHELPFDFSLNDHESGNFTPGAEPLSPPPIAHPVPLPTSTQSHNISVTNTIKRTAITDPSEVRTPRSTTTDAFDTTVETAEMSYTKNVKQPTTTENTSSPLCIPHRGSLRRILSPHGRSMNNNHVKSHLSPSTPLSRKEDSTLKSMNSSEAGTWPIYSITIAASARSSSNSLTAATTNLKNPQPLFHYQHSRIHSDNSHSGQIYPSHEHQDHTRTQQHQYYEVIFDRQQYEFCTRLFALLDTESKNIIGPDCIREFVCLHSPMARRRDEAILIRRRSEKEKERTLELGKDESKSSQERGGPKILNGQNSMLKNNQSGTLSPTFDEIWDNVIHCDPRRNHGNTDNPMSFPTTNVRIGLEGWMLFCRLLALAHHQESQRRFASRHLQQMMRHKHGGSSRTTRGRIGGGSNSEVVVVVDNPPPGPPTLISIEGLVQVEQERTRAGTGGNNKNCLCIQGMSYNPLPLPELDLDHYLVSADSFGAHEPCQARKACGRVTIEPFSPSKGDFILRYESRESRNTASRSFDTTKSSEHNPCTSSTIVRRSYADFEWLHGIFKSHKRPGYGHLCGRIIPPFPPTQFRPHYHSTSLRVNSSNPRVEGNFHHHQDVSERAVAAAKSGMGMITSMAKSLWGSYVSTTPSSSLSSESSLSSSPARKKMEQRGKITSSNGVSNVVGNMAPRANWLGSREENTPAEVAHRMQRYLNFLLENPALSTSFPLNAILKASQSGLESAKQTLQEHAKKKKRQKLSQISPAPDGKQTLSSIWSVLASKKSSPLFDPHDDDTPWLRAAAQVAMALQLHGILETAGREISSAKIQHASLPKFSNHLADSWDDEDSNNLKEREKQHKSSKLSSISGGKCFEAGVINIESELDDEENIGGYDLLPPPGPTEEHHVLSAGSTISPSMIENENPSRYPGKTLQPTRSGFVYGMTTEQDRSPVKLDFDDTADAALGSIKVDHDIDKLREIIRSMNYTLGKIHQASLAIQTAQQGKNGIQLDILRDIDSWGDSHGEVITQRALVGGVAELERVNVMVRESNIIMCNDLLWQSSLATSAVAAANEVRYAVKASRTASRAKSAAFVAAQKAKRFYESCSSSSKEDKKSAQTEASISQSHAIHAAVVEYEANIAKKRTAVALAHDVKCWNIHRRRELLQTCIRLTRSQQEACRQAATAWESLRDGLIESSRFSFQDRRNEVNIMRKPRDDIPEYTATIMNPSGASGDGMKARTICPVENHYVLRELDVTIEDNEADDCLSVKDDDNVLGLRHWAVEKQDRSNHIVEVEKNTALTSLITASPPASPLPEVFIGSYKSQENDHNIESSAESFSDVYHLTLPMISSLDDEYFSLGQDIGMEKKVDDNDSAKASSRPLVEHAKAESTTEFPREPPESEHKVVDLSKVKHSESENAFEDKLNQSHVGSVHDDENEDLAHRNAMTTSMQSLIDGLMAWGDADGTSSEFPLTMDDTGVDDIQNSSYLLE